VQNVVGQQMIQDIKERADLATESFHAKYPEAKQYEARMMELARTIQPAPGVPVIKYFEQLLTLAKSSKGGGAATRKALDRMVAAASSEPRPGGSPNRSVSHAKPDRSKMTRTEFLRASAEAADKGIRWERE